MLTLKLSTLATVLGCSWLSQRLWGAQAGRVRAGGAQVPAPFGRRLRARLAGYRLVPLLCEPGDGPGFPAHEAVSLHALRSRGIGTCFYVRDYLAVRGLAVVLLLCAKLMVDTARMEETDWRLVIVTLAYVWVFAGMWLTISPWRLRDLIHWATASEQRTRLLSGLRLGFALLVVALGLTVFK